MKQKEGRKKKKNEWWLLYVKWKGIRKYSTITVQTVIVLDVNFSSLGYIYLYPLSGSWGMEGETENLGTTYPRMLCQWGCGLNSISTESFIQDLEDVRKVCTIIALLAAMSRCVASNRWQWFCRFPIFYKLPALVFKMAKIINSSSFFGIPARWHSNDLPMIFVSV